MSRQTHRLSGRKKIKKVGLHHNTQRPTCQKLLSEPAFYSATPRLAPNDVGRASSIALDYDFAIADYQWPHSLVVGKSKGKYQMIATWRNNYVR